MLVPKALTDVAPHATGRPVMHKEPWEKITVTVLDRHAGYLDVMSVLIRMRYHKAVSRAELIRCLIDFMEQSRIDFTRFENAQEMVDYLIEHFRNIPDRGHFPFLLDSSLFHPDRTTPDESHQDESRQIEEEEVHTPEALVNA